MSNTISILKMGILSCLLFFFACAGGDGSNTSGQGKGNLNGKTDKGVAYEVYKNTNDNASASGANSVNTIKDGDVVKVHLSYINKTTGKTIFDSSKRNRPIPMRFTDKFLNGTLYEIMQKMSVGDSLVAGIPAKLLDKVPSDVKPSDILEHHIKVVEVKQVPKIQDSGEED